MWINKCAGLLQVLQCLMCVFPGVSAQTCWKDDWMSHLLLAPSATDSTVSRRQSNMPWLIERTEKATSAAVSNSNRNPCYLQSVYYYTSCGACRHKSCSCFALHETAHPSPCPSPRPFNAPLFSCCLSLQCALSKSATFTTLISDLPSNWTEMLTVTIIQGLGWSKVSSVSPLQAWILIKDYSLR